MDKQYVQELEVFAATALGLLAAMRVLPEVPQHYKEVVEVAVGDAPDRIVVPAVVARMSFESSAREAGL